MVWSSRSRADGGPTSLGHEERRSRSWSRGVLHHLDFVRCQAVETIDDFVYQTIREGKRGFQRQELVFRLLKTGADFFFVGDFEAEFVGAEMGKDFGSFKPPKLVELGFGLQDMSIDAVKIFEVSLELFDGGAFLLIEGCHLLGKECEQVVDDIRAFGFGRKLLHDEEKYRVLVSA